MTNKTYIILLLTIMPLHWTMAQSPRFYQTECEAMEKGGHVTIKIWRTKRGAAYKPHHAQKDAIHAVLYAGVAGDKCLAQQPLLGGAEEKDNFKKVEKRFFKNNGVWSRYTKSSSLAAALPDKLGNKNWKVYQVSVSKEELKKYLEEQKIIKTLTDGF